MRLLPILLFSLLFIPHTLASVGVGVAPSKVNYTLESGTTFVDTYLFYNTGTEPIRIHIQPEGAIAPFTKITPAILELVPEPEYQTFPPKNGKTVHAYYTPPPSITARTYMGMIAASGSAGKLLFEEYTAETDIDSLISLGMGVTIYAEPATTWWAFVTPKRILKTSSIFLILTSLFLFYYFYFRPKKYKSVQKK